MEFDFPFLENDIAMTKLNSLNQHKEKIIRNGFLVFGLLLSRV